MKPCHGIASLLIAAVLSQFGGCTRNGPVAGITSETTNGDMEMSLTLSSGAPAARVRVLVVEDGDWIGKVSESLPLILDTLYTDDRGGLALHMPIAHRRNLQIDNGEEGLFVRQVNAMLDTGGHPSRRKFSLAAYGGLSGHVHSDSGPVKELRLAGTALIATLDADSGYAFPRVPAGTFAIVAMADRGGSLQPFATHSIGIAAGVQQTGQDVGVLSSRIPVDDFEQGWKQTALGRILGEGLWYTATDIEEKGNSSVKVDLFNDSQAHAGSSVRAEFILGNRLSNPWSVMGFGIGASGTGDAHDFSGLTAISFWAKGQGTVDIRFMSRILTRETKDTAQYFHPVKLPSAWTWITVPVDSLRLPAAAQEDLHAFPWKTVAKEIMAVDFTVEPPSGKAGDTTVLWLDDIHFEGVSLKDIAH